MKIFVRCQGDPCGRGALTDFVRRALRGPWYTGFRQRGEVVDCRVVRVMDLSGRRVEYHGLVEVRPARIGWYLVQRLDGRQLLGAPAQVRKWFDRDGRCADRRRLAGLSAYPRHLDRRSGHERRRMVRLQLLDDLPNLLTRQPRRARR